MTPLKYLISAEHGCCNTRELLEYKRADPQGYETLKQWAIEEMRNRGMEVTAE